jgi:hypothetical protein
VADDDGTLDSEFAQQVMDGAGDLDRHPNYILAAFMASAT